MAVIGDGAKRQTHLWIVELPCVPLFTYLVSIVQTHERDFFTSEICSLRFKKPGGFCCSAGRIDRTLDVQRNFPWQRRRRRSEALGDLLDIHKRLGSLRHVRDLFPVAHHREHGEHEKERRGGHDSRRGRYKSLRAGLLVTGSLRCLGSRARFVELKEL